VTNYVFQAPTQAALTIQDSNQLFPIHRIYCVGRNFADHAKEMGAEVPKGTPVFFMKPADAATQSSQIPYPTATHDLHHEVELVVALGADIPQELTIDNAMQSVFAFGIGLDLTRRDLQAIAKEKRLPWDISKGFDFSAPISLLVEAKQTTLLPNTLISLRVNDQLRQQASVNDMIFSIPDILIELSKLFKLQAGDLIFMGTPAGVAALQRGDTFTAELQNIVTLSGTLI
jgi:fumarylpyruvate hydrolase